MEFKGEVLKFRGAGCGCTPGLKTWIISVTKGNTYTVPITKSIHFATSAKMNENKGELF